MGGAGWLWKVHDRLEFLVDGLYSFSVDPVAQEIQLCGGEFALVQRDREVVVMQSLEDFIHCSDVVRFAVVEYQNIVEITKNVAHTRKDVGHHFLKRLRCVP